MTTSEIAINLYRLSQACDGTLDSHQLADRLNVSERTIRRWAIRAAEIGVKLNIRTPGTAVRTVRVTNNRTISRLMPEAQKRGLTVGELGTMLLDIIAEENMVSAILDDADDVHVSKPATDGG